MKSESIDRIRREQDAFDRLLPELLEEHRGEYAVFRDGKPVGFYSTHDVAYRAALDCCGLDAVFLVCEVTEVVTETVSVAWEFGLMSG